MVGEENEYDWSRMAHLVSSGRVSSSARRRQKIDAYGIFTGRRMKERMGRILQCRYQRAIDIENQSRLILKGIVGTTLQPLSASTTGKTFNITIDYLHRQAKKQEEHFINFKYVFSTPQILLNAFNTD